MARALIVGCGCRGRELGGQLLAEGWAVRGTSRRREGLEAIAAAGIEPAQADPIRPSTVLDLVGDVTALVWLLGSARGGVPELVTMHGHSLEALLPRLVETPVRKVVYEAGGTVHEDMRGLGAEIVRQAGKRWRIRVAMPKTVRASDIAKLG